MIYPKTTLQNPYYFIKDKVLYNISNQQDTNNEHTSSQGCGVHKVTYITETKKVEKGQVYLNLHGDLQTAADDTNYSVSTGKLDETECQKVFPYFTVTYNKTNPAEGEEGTITKTYWLQHLIQDGDKVVNNKFVINEKHGTTYSDAFKKEMKEAVKSAIIGGATIEQLYSMFPLYFFSGQPNKTTKVTDNSGKLVDATYNTSTVAISERDLWTLIYEALDEKVRAYANNCLKPYKKKVKDSVKFITSDNVQDINATPTQEAGGD